MPTPDWDTLRRLGKQADSALKADDHDRWQALLDSADDLDDETAALAVELLTPLEPTEVAGDE